LFHFVQVPCDKEATVVAVVGGGVFGVVVVFVVVVAVGVVAVAVSLLLLCRCCCYCFDC
jgi:hypothetical protein